MLGFYRLQLCLVAVLLPKAAAQDEHVDDSEFSLPYHLEVIEGGQSVITSANMDVILSSSTNVHGDSYVLFRIVRPPSHGQVIENGDLSDKPRPLMVFTASDVHSNRVAYAHDDSEESRDSIDIQLTQLSPEGWRTKELTHPGSKSLQFTLHILILPKNDPPTLFLWNETLVVIANSRLKMTPTLLNASDADDPPTELLYYIHYQAGFDGGYFEVVDISGSKSKVMQFTQMDVINGNLQYINRGAPLQQVRLQVSDGKDISGSMTLRIEAVDLRVETSVNIEQVMSPHSAELITAEHLKFTTNALLQCIDMRFEIKTPAKFGRVQRRRYADDEWTDTWTFTETHIQTNRLRYVHDPLLLRTSGDEFRFQIIALGMRMNYVDFRLKFVETSVKLIKNSGLRLKGLNEGFITAEVLLAESTIPFHTPSCIIYHITALPRKGYLSIIKDRVEYQRVVRRRLAVGKNFSQADVNNKVIEYKLMKTQSGLVVDDFEFEVIVPGFKLEALPFRFVYEPSFSGPRLINNGLRDVSEGESKPITADDLFTEGEFLANTIYTIEEGPFHGRLQLAHFVTGLVEQNNISSFTNDDIVHQRLHYHHDNSETDSDYFSFKSTSIQSGIAQGHVAIELSGVIEVWINLRNDNPPIRRNDRVFRVLPDRGRTITPDDLWFVDPDINYDDLLLQYHWMDMTNGEIVLASNHTIRINRFTQKDIATGRLHFTRNSVPSNHNRSSACLFRVTDGLHFVSGVFRVETVDAFVRVRSVTHLRIEEIKTNVQLLPRYFNVETNVEATDNDVNFAIINTIKSCGTLRKKKKVPTATLR